MLSSPPTSSAHLVPTSPMFSYPFRAAISCATLLSILRWNRTKNELVKMLFADDATNVVDPSKKYNHPNNIALCIRCLGGVSFGVCVRSRVLQLYQLLFYCGSRKAMRIALVLHQNNINDNNNNNKNVILPRSMCRWSYYRDGCTVCTMLYRRAYTQTHTLARANTGAFIMLALVLLCFSCFLFNICILFRNNVHTTYVTYGRSW